jgi:hypothetical protein
LSRRPTRSTGFDQCWCRWYSLIYTFQPGSFDVSTNGFNGQGIHQGTVNEIIYFSNVTLTTLGYGDIVPISRPARTFATLEAMLGQLYLAIVIARLVGLHVTDKK